MRQFEAITPPAHEPDTRSTPAWIAALATDLEAAEKARAEALAQIAADEAFARALESATPTYYAGPGRAVIADAECARCHGWNDEGVDAPVDTDDEEDCHG